MKIIHVLIWLVSAWCNRTVLQRTLLPNDWRCKVYSNEAYLECMQKEGLLPHVDVTEILGQKIERFNFLHVDRLYVECGKVIPGYTIHTKMMLLTSEQGFTVPCNRSAVIHKPISGYVENDDGKFAVYAQTPIVQKELVRTDLEDTKRDVELDVDVNEFIFHEEHNCKVRDNLYLCTVSTGQNQTFTFASATGMVLKKEILIVFKPMSIVCNKTKDSCEMTEKRHGQSSIYMIGWDWPVWIKGECVSDGDDSLVSEQDGVYCKKTLPKSFVTGLWPSDTREETSLAKVRGQVTKVQYGNRAVLFVINTPEMTVIRQTVNYTQGDEYSKTARPAAVHGVELYSTVWPCRHGRCFFSTKKDYHFLEHVTTSHRLVWHVHLIKKDPTLEESSTVVTTVAKAAVGTVVSGGVGLLFCWLTQ